MTIPMLQSLTGRRGVAIRLSASMALAVCVSPMWAAGQQPPVAEGTGGVRSAAASRPPRLTTNPADGITSARIERAPNDEPQNWLTYHGSYDGQRYSRLSAITAANAPTLKEAWQLHLPIPHGFEATPLVVDGVMYFTTGGHTTVYAVEGKSGHELWHHTFAVAKDVPACCDWVNRGVAIGNGKVYVATLDAKLVALDARTGEVSWQTTLADYKDGYSATGAPLLVNDKVIVGIAGGEYGIRGFIDAYDANTGKRAWRFWTIPDAKQPGHETWGGDQPTWMTGGGSAWTTGVYDPALGLVYWTTGNPGPDFNGEVRPGDNLYTNSVVALDPNDGTLRWHYQWTPHDVWDYDGVNEAILADLTIDGRPVKALIHADKNGYYYVLDRTNGKLLAAKAFTRVTWSKRIDLQSGRPVLDSMSLPSAAMEPVCPSSSGGKEWNHMSFSSQTNMAYIPVIDDCQTFRTGEAYYKPGLPFWGSLGKAATDGPGESHGHLLAVNAATGDSVWAMKSDYPVMSGVLSTAGGLVFWGEANGMLHATDARSGKDVWTHQAPMGIHAPPMTYAVDGKQYVAFPVGWGGWINGFAPFLRGKPRGHLLMVFALP